MIGPSRSACAGRDALPRVRRCRRCTSRRFFLPFLRTRSCAIGAEALSHQLNEVFALLGRAAPDRAGARPYQLQQHRLIKSPNLVYRLAYNDDVAAGQLAVFQGASDAEKQPTGRGPEGCVENGPAAALLVGYVPHHFWTGGRKPDRR